MNGDRPGAISSLQRALDIDPEFAMAHAQLGFHYGGIGQLAQSVQSTTRAWQLRHRVSDRERFFIEFTYEGQVTGNLENAYRTLELWLRRTRAVHNPMPAVTSVDSHHKAPVV